MRAFIYHSQVSGLGDCYSDVVAYTNLSKFLRSVGYDVGLLYLPPSRVHHIDNFYYHFYDKDNSLRYFNSITELKVPLKSYTYDGTSYFNEWKESLNDFNDITLGNHWDLFCDNNQFINLLPGYIKDNNIHLDDIKPIFSVFRYDCGKFLRLRHKFNLDKPIINKQAVEKSKSFCDNLNNKFNYLQLRFRREDKELERDKDFVNNLKNYIKVNLSSLPLVIGGNSNYINNVLEGFENVVVYKDDKEKSDILLDLVQMVSIKDANKVYYYNELSWVSNFLLYALIQRPNLEVEDVTKILKRN